MDGYSEIGAIYFCIGNRTGYARYADNGKIETGNYEGVPPYETLAKNPPKELLEYHAAEHQVYNAFMKKIKKLPIDTTIEDFRKFVPNIDEVQKTHPFSFFCGTTFFLGSGILLLFSCAPNILQFHNKDPEFMLPWLGFCLFFTFLTVYIVQNKFFLARAKIDQLILGIEALKEALK